ncbi:MAG: glycosyl hydrolase family 8 [Candidatus Margulisbacteria bacterium]|nr:glycosyl hydrolase family 8 [Candidatus Margulisiibacteriota bacterium]
MEKKKNKNLKQKIAIAIAVVVIIIILLLLHSCQTDKNDRDKLAKYRKDAYNLLYITWKHYITHENFEGDWWSEKFKHPKMIMDDGRPNAFMDGVDQDADGLKDIDWSNPKKPFELVAVSESSSYALLRAVIIKDKKTFDKVWNWTKNNLQHSQINWVYYWKDLNSPKNGWKTPDELGIERDNLFAWRWTPTISPRNNKNKSEDGIVYYRWQQPTEEHNPNDPWRDGWDAASDADQDIALALIFADALWGSKKGDRVYDYAENARLVLKDIWNKETYINKEHRYMAGGNNIKSVEPGYLSPFSYRIFDDFDPEHNWMDLVDSSYRIFDKSSTAVLSDWIDKTGEVHNQNPYKKKTPYRANLLPDWVSLSKTGDVTNGVEREEPEFGTDAFRGLWRAAVDYDWNKDRRAAEYLRQHSPNGPYDFLNFRMHDKHGDWAKTKNYDESRHLASVYWHDGDYCLYESNYEPPANALNRLEDANDYRANCAQYAVYLSYFWASYEHKPGHKTFDMIEKLVTPIIIPDQDGFSHRAYVIPDDQLARETAANIAKQTPVEKRNPKAEIGIPYHDGDGWLCTDSDGKYWTIFDHSEWNCQMDYFSNTWTWLGLAFFAGAFKNQYKYQNVVPDIKNFYVYLDKDYQFRATDYINTEAFYIRATGKDKNPFHRDYFYMKVQTTQKDAKPITIKMVETGKHTGVYQGMGYIGLDSSDAADRVAGSVGKYVDFIVMPKPNLKKRYRIGAIILTNIIEDFEDGNPFDANPMAWWTDSLKPESGKPKFTIGKDKGIYIWKDTEWHIRFLGNGDNEVFSGMILTDGLMNAAKTSDLKNNSTIQQLRKSLNFTIIEKNGATGIDFTASGRFIIFDIKYNGYYQSGAFAIGVNGDTAFGAPLILRNEGETGTYKLKINKEMAVNSKYSLQIDKKYIGKPYPYLGGVLFNPEHMDWTRYDEFTFDVYLPYDVGTIRCDIQDIDGTVVILNEYNPWNEKKGPGWYKWRSNTSQGLAVNADLAQPFSIRYRDWWKGWSFDDNRNVDRTKEIDLTKIRNVMFCINGGNEDMSQILIDNLSLERINYNYGYHPPRYIRKINLFSDPGYKKPINLAQALMQEDVYVEVTGKDSSPDTFDKFSLRAETSDKYPGCHDIDVELLETAENSGIYRGSFKIGVQSDPSHGIIGAAEGHQVKLYSDVNKGLIKRLQVGRFKITTVVDDFDDLAAGQKPDSWWIDTIDPASGRPIYPAGQKLGYFVWKEGNIWRMRWSADQKLHHFTGDLFTDKTLKIIQKYYLQGNDRIDQITPKHIHFDTNEQYAEDGFDFITDGKFVEFHPFIDNEKFPDRTWVGPYDWNKAYTIPFTVNNVGKTRSYDLLISNKLAVSKPNSMQVHKTYFSKDYPYIGKWGLSADLSKWNDKDEFSMWIYLRDDIGNIRVDLEDNNRQTACLHEYDPYDARKGPGWYKWTSSYQSGVALAERKIDGRPIKDRQFWTSYDTHLEKNIDVTKKFNLGNILNIELCFGGGEKRDALVNIDNLHVTHFNRHIGYTNPLRIKEIKLYSDPQYKNEIKKLIKNQTVYLELIGEDGDKNTQDKTFAEIMTNDKFPINKKISVAVDETGSHTGIYRGKFKIGLETDDKEDIIGASWHSVLSIWSVVNLKYIKKYPVGLIELVYVIDDFDDSSIDDKYPVTWWIGGAKPENRSYLLQATNFENHKVMYVKKKYAGDDYPYFGAWGLKSDVEKWSDKEDFVMELYLKKDPGEIRVDIQDRSGNLAVLNGYNPWDDKKGPGWYEWRASTGIGRDAKNELVDVNKLNVRKFWKGWDPNQQQYVDMTQTIDLDHIQNVQFLIDSEGQEGKEIWIDKIYLVNHNYYLGFTAPKIISRYNFYYDPGYMVEISKKGEIIFRDNHAEIVGIDEDPNRLDVFNANVLIWDKKESYPAPVMFRETDVHSGVYHADFDLLKFKHPTSDRVPTIDNYVSIYLSSKDKSQKLRIKSLLAFDWSLLEKYLKSIGGKGKGFGWPWWWLLLIIVIIILTVVYYYYQKTKKQKIIHPDKVRKSKLRFK